METTPAGYAALRTKIARSKGPVGKLRETFAPCRRNEAELGKVGSERIDQLRALTD
ncbi:hypothetical protein JQ611_36260 [Bradyrhizobium sp. AUGA SZCCT0182]|nr:hypothetical protein [Bradyrhizobium sp. AUGA SZCCT0182]MBR1237481.1 hypothetical protein [Bradyrhizobium sp. AUGA SZCCT0182]